ncbi:MAG TPA: hypothetical protein VGP47_11710 [Parachlamydiaceae bacterium]|nr:hypothetical protein [Parachlamydiaceae bacterium]
MNNLQPFNNANTSIYSNLEIYNLSNFCPLQPILDTKSLLSTLPNFQLPQLHSREIDVQKLLGQEALLFDPKDAKPKLLYLLAKADATNAFPINSPFVSI